MSAPHPAAGAGALDAKIARIEGLIGAIEASSDVATRAAARELTEAVLSLHATALERILGILAGAGADREGGEGRGIDGPALAKACGDDPVVAAVLHLHGLHPSPLATRVASAIDGVRPSVIAAGGDVVLGAIEDGVARIHLEGPSKAIAMRRAVEDAVAAAAPDLEAVDVAVVEQPVLVQLRTSSRKVG